MRRCFLPVILCMLFYACTEDVDLYIEGDPVPVVYCLLNPQSSEQFVRLGRTFYIDGSMGIDRPDTDSTTWNQQYEIYVEEYSDGDRIALYNFSPFTRFVKDTGFFPQDNLRVYESDFQPAVGNFYHLYVYFPEMNKMVSAETLIHEAPEILDPMNLSMRTITFGISEPYTVRWNPGENSGVYQCIFRIHYQNSLSSATEFHFADYISPGYYNISTGDMLDYLMSGNKFFQTMSKEIPVIPGVSRKVLSVEFIMISGGINLGYHFRSINQTGDVFSNLGDYSNILNGLGIFSSYRENRVPNLLLSPITLDELAHGTTTANLGFETE